MHRAFRGLSALAFTLVLSAGGVTAAELKVVCVGALAGGMKQVAADFAKETGMQVTVVQTNPTSVNQALAAKKPIESLASDQAFDVMVVAHPSMEAYDKQGAFKAGSRSAVLRAGIGVTVRAGAAKPDLSTAEGFKQAIMTAKSVVYGDPAQENGSGAVVAQVLQKAGLADAAKGKARIEGLGQGKELIAKGEAELGLFNLSEAAGEGVAVAGAVPAPLQSYTSYDAAVSAKSAQPEQAARFIAFLASARDSWSKAGNEMAAK
jgi:molybdate transport system substrate-binding protein